MQYRLGMNLAFFLFVSVVVFLNKNYDAIFHGEWSRNYSDQQTVMKLVPTHASEVEHAIRIVSRTCLTDLIGDKPLAPVIAAAEMPFLDILALPSIKAGKLPSDEEFEQARQRTSQRISKKLTKQIGNLPEDEQRFAAAQMQLLKDRAEKFRACLFEKTLEKLSVDKVI
jgi:hypothetical protein